MKFDFHIIMTSTFTLHIRTEVGRSGCKYLNATELHRHGTSTMGGQLSARLGCVRTLTIKYGGTVQFKHLV